MQKECCVSKFKHLFYLPIISSLINKNMIKQARNMVKPFRHHILYKINTKLRYFRSYKYALNINIFYSLYLTVKKLLALIIVANWNVRCQSDCALTIHYLTNWLLLTFCHIHKDYINFAKQVYIVRDKRVSHV